MVWGSVWASEGPVWLRSAHRWLSWAYFRRPFSCSGQFCTGQPWTRSKNIEKSGKTVRFESKNLRHPKKFKENHRFESKINVFCAKMDQPRDAQGYTHPSWDAQGTPTQAQGYTHTSCNGSAARIQPRMAQVDVIEILPW